jgi:Zn-dependent protease with chaperone function
MTAIPKFVDAKTGNIKKFETFFEKVDGDFLPKLGTYALMGIKIGILAPLVGGVAVALPVAGAALLAGRLGGRAFINFAIEKVFIAPKRKEHLVYDFSKEKDIRRFEKKFSGTSHASFVDDYKKLAAMAHLKAPPRLIMADLLFDAQKTQASSRDIVGDYMAGTIARPDGGGAVIILGKGALQSLNREEMRAVMAHEMTHLALRHPDRKAKEIGTGFLNMALNIGLLGAAVFGSLPVLPVLGFVVASNLVGRALSSIQSRHHEALCDRGAALMTGGTDDMSTALEKISTAMKKARQASADRRNIQRGKPLEPVQERGRVDAFLNAPHPPLPKRKSLMEAFNRQYPEYCAARKNIFSAPPPAKKAA